MRVYRPTTPASSLVNADESVPISRDLNACKGSGARLDISRANKSILAPQATSTGLLKNVILPPSTSNLPIFAGSPSVPMPISDIPVFSKPKTTSSPARSISPESQPSFSNSRASDHLPPDAATLRNKDGAASRLEPQATLMKAVQPPTESLSVKKISNFSISRGGCKRDKILQSTPKPSHEVNTSVLTTPGVQPFSSSRLRLDDNPIPLAAPVGPSQNKITTSTKRISASSKGKQKQKQLVTPLEYAQVLSKKLEIFSKKADFLKGKKLFYTGGDMQYASQSTKKRMELVRFLSI